MVSFPNKISNDDWLKMGDMYLISGKAEEAIEYFDNAIEKWPNFADALHNK
jgi:tetratricopeptide (TPR) repeat protein